MTEVNQLNRVFEACTGTLGKQWSSYRSPPPAPPPPNHHPPPPSLSLSLPFSLSFSLFLPTYLPTLPPAPPSSIPHPPLNLSQVYQPNFLPAAYLSLVYRLRQT